MKTIKIRLVKDDNGDFIFKYRDSDIARTSYGISSLLEEGIGKGEISKGTKIVDKDYTKYTFDFHDNKDFKYAQEPIKIEIRVRNEYIDYVHDSLKSLDALCMTTNYIRTKNIAKILGISLAAVVFLSFAGSAIAERIKNPLGEEKKTSYEYEDYKEQMSNYYRALKEKADSGDVDAIGEYNKYLTQLNLNKIYNDVGEEIIYESKNITRR